MPHGVAEQLAGERVPEAGGSIFGGRDDPPTVRTEVCHDQRTLKKERKKLTPPEPLLLLPRWRIQRLAMPQRGKGQAERTIGQCTHQSLRDNVIRWLLSEQPRQVRQAPGGIARLQQRLGALDFQARDRSLRSLTFLLGKLSLENLSAPFPQHAGETDDQNNNEGGR